MTAGWRRLGLVPTLATVAGIAVTAALGGTSPRQVPRLVTPEIRYPSSGNALYVFALPQASR